ncbi:MAG: biopolymer transporter ExbD [Elusimicrobia bacterium]|nr:biopolymer transporter ExbD [Candidatus Obscuribacterium magneticum]
MKRLKPAEEAVSGVNVVPIIDVTLVLLVILLVMSPIVNLPNLPVELPEAMTKEMKEQNVSVSLSVDGMVSVDQEIVDWQDLPKKLRQALRGREDLVVIVRADKSLPYGVVENLIKVVNRNAGTFPVAIATRQRMAPLEGEKKQ